MTAQVKELAAAVAAKLAYWEALSVLEKSLAPDEEELTDRQNDALVDTIDDLAASGPDSTDVESWVTDEHLEELKSRLKLS